MENVQLAGKRLLSFGVRNVLVTLGEKGAMLINQTGAKLYPSIPAKAVDTTAAGDTFNGAFVVGLAEGKSVDEAVAFCQCGLLYCCFQKRRTSFCSNKKRSGELVKNFINTAYSILAIAILSSKLKN